MKLILYAFDDLILKFLRNKGDRIKRPSSVFLIIGLRVTHGHQMAHTPRHNRLIRFHIAVAVFHIIF